MGDSYYDYDLSIFSYQKNQIHKRFVSIGADACMRY